MATRQDSVSSLRSCTVTVQSPGCVRKRSGWERRVYSLTPIRQLIVLRWFPLLARLQRLTDVSSPLSFDSAEHCAVPRILTQHRVFIGSPGGLSLGGVDEFDQAEAGGEGDDRPEVPGCLFASERDALEPLEASDALLDAGGGPCRGCVRRRLACSFRWPCGE